MRADGWVRKYHCSSVLDISAADNIAAAEAGMISEDRTVKRTGHDFTFLFRCHDDDQTVSSANQFFQELR